jgi:hypothetical protein
MAKSVLISNVLPQESLDLIPAGIDVDYHDSELALSKADLIKRLQGRAGLVCHVLSTIDEELLAAVPGLQVVATSPSASTTSTWPPLAATGSS